MYKNPLFNIVKEDVKVDREYSRQNTAMQTPLFRQPFFYKPIMRLLSKESIVLMSDLNDEKNEKL